MSEKRIIKFMSHRKIAAIISIVLVVVSIGSLVVNKLNFGLDFTGGTSVELRYEETADLSAIRSLLKEGGYSSAVVTNFGTDKDVAIRIQANDPKLGDIIINLLKNDTDGQVELKRVSFVGSQVGEELRDDGGLGMLFALIVVMAYVAIRFQIKFSVGAVVALAHDVMIVLGVFSILQLDFDLTVLAAILAVIGYSLNDTIVVADRIRENFRKIRKGTSLEIIDISLTETLGRTIITSFTTLLVLFALFFVGGEIIHNFAIALIIGVLVGTYSSIYVAANILLAMNISSEDLMVVEKEGADHDEIVL